jgi:hypothetical protein
MDIDMNDMLVYFRPERDTIGTVGLACQLYIRLVAKPRQVPWYQADVLLISEGLIKSFEPVNLNEPVSA